MDLAEDIARHGFLQSLDVRAFVDVDGFEAEAILDNFRARIENGGYPKIKEAADRMVKWCRPMKC